VEVEGIILSLTLGSGQSSHNRFEFARFIPVLFWLTLVPVEGQLDLAFVVLTVKVGWYAWELIFLNPLSVAGF
jgi:hypothetical protein